jgi:hypothetical protein
LDIGSDGVGALVSAHRFIEEQAERARALGLPLHPIPQPGSYLLGQAVSPVDGDDDDIGARSFAIHSVISNAA